MRFLGDSLKCLRDFPESARHDAGYQLDKVQRGAQPDDFKPLAAVGKGVEEVRITDDSGAYRVIYVARRADRHRRETLRAIVERCEMKNSESCARVWDALADTPGQAASLRARAELLQQIAVFVNRQGWTQVEAAHCGVTQPRAGRS